MKNKLPVTDVLYLTVFFDCRQTFWIMTRDHKRERSMTRMDLSTQSWRRWKLVDLLGLRITLSLPCTFSKVQPDLSKCAYIGLWGSSSILVFLSLTRLTLHGLKTLLEWSTHNYKDKLFPRLHNSLSNTANVFNSLSNTPNLVVQAYHQVRLIINFFFLQHGVLIILSTQNISILFEFNFI